MSPGSVSGQSTHGARAPRSRLVADQDFAHSDRVFRPGAARWAAATGEVRSLVSARHVRGAWLSTRRGTSTRPATLRGFRRVCSSGSRRPSRSCRSPPSPPRASQSRPAPPLSPIHSVRPSGPTPRRCPCQPALARRASADPPPACPSRLPCLPTLPRRPEPARAGLPPPAPARPSLSSRPTRSPPPPRLPPRGLRHARSPGIVRERAANAFCAMRPPTPASLWPARLLRKRCGDRPQRPCVQCRAQV